MVIAAVAFDYRYKDFIMGASPDQNNDHGKVAISQLNSAYWDELCGTSAAKHLGIEDSSVKSLKIFDDWYFSFYPYLYLHIPFEDLRDKDVLEIGLGYGTVSQRLAESRCRYNGLDIAAGPVDMVNQRLKAHQLPPTAKQGSILDAPFADESFDYIVAIGCLHHTGDLKRAISECNRMLRPGGKLIFMVYYSYSLRRFSDVLMPTLGYMARELIGYRGTVGESGARERAAYDSNQSGDAAPHTDWISIRSLRAYCSSFSKFSGRIENIDNGHKPFKTGRSRRELLMTRYPQWIGLDLYATATK
jgi:SAM-dependent methyltransferase